MTTVLGTTVLVSGSESLLADRAVAHQVKGARAEDPQIEVTRVSAADLDGGRLAEASGGSLFSATRVLVIDHLDQLDQGLFDAVHSLATDTPEDLALVLVHPGGVKGKGLLDRLKKAKVPQVDATAPKPWELARFVQAEAGRHHLTCDEPAAQALVDAVGTDLRSLSQAVVQLGSDADGQPITPALVSTYFGGRAEVTSFAVADDILGGRPGAALEKLRWALSTGVAPVLVTSALAGQLRSLGKYLDLRSSRLNDGEMAREVGVPPWKVKDLNRLSRAWNQRAVAAGVKAVAKADADIKGAATDPEYALEQLLIALDQARDRPR